VKESSLLKSKGYLARFELLVTFQTHYVKNVFLSIFESMEKATATITSLVVRVSEQVLCFGIENVAHRNLIT